MRLIYRLRLLNNNIILDSAFNAGRSLINPLFIAAISYLFIYRQLESELQTINKITAIVNLLLIFSGWGLKDFLMKESVKPFSEFNNTWRLAFYSKFLLIVPLVVFSILFLDGYLLIWLILVFVLRTLNALYEPLVISHKRPKLFFSIDFINALLAIALIAGARIKTAEHFFYFLTASEMFKLFICQVIFKTPDFFSFNNRELFFFLKQTRFYFFLVSLSFFQSKADLYLLGFLLKPEKLNEYQLLSSLLSLAQIVITAFVVNYSKLLYRSIHNSERVFKNIVIKCGCFAAIVSSFGIYFVMNFVYNFHFEWFNVFVLAINVLSFTYVLYEMFYYTKKDWQRKALLYVSYAGIINFVFSFLLISRFGVTGALTGNSLGLLLLAIIMSRGRVNGSVNKNI